MRGLLFVAISPSSFSPHNTAHAQPQTMAFTATATVSSLYPKPRKPEFPKKPIPFPLTLQSNNNPEGTQFRPLRDSSSDNDHHNRLTLYRNYQLTPTPPHKQQQQQQRVFIQDPPWINALFFKTLRTEPKIKLERNDIDKPKFNSLRRRQIREETEVWERSVEEYRELQREMCEKKLAPNLPYVKSLFLGWFEPLRDAIRKEQEVQMGKPKRLRASHADFVGLLPADKMAVIVMHKFMGLVLMGGSAEEEEGCVRVVQAAVQIGVAIEHEVRMHSFLEKTKNYQGKKTATNALESLSKDKQILRKRINNFVKKRRGIELQKLLKHEFKPWGRDNQAKLGSRLLELLIETAYVNIPIDQAADNPPDIRPAFTHRIKAASIGPGQKVRMKYGVIECDSSLLAGLDDNAKHMNIPYVPMLIPPKNWKGYDKGGHLFLPSYIMRTRGSRKQQDAIKNAGKQMQKVFEALNTLGNTKWRVNRRVLAVVESLWDKGGNVAGLVDRADVPVPERPFSEDSTEIQEWKWKARKAKKINGERHSLRCDTELKLSVARKMKDEEGFYYPHNLDFRGRAYPMHPYLNHLSSDLCRGVLEFAEGRPLGISGLHWLKIHIANLYGAGIDKLSYDERLAFVENHLDQIFDSAEHPIDGNRWWLTAEDPFQFLAACISLSESLKSSSPHTVISHLPIHQDGSCNGLQHYAALGRNSLEAAAVNLVAGEKPADVYSEIAWRVHDIMKEDSEKDPSSTPYASLAKVLIDQVDRKLVKQTVMTSVYGVTYIGAREQIKKRLQEKGLITDDRLLFSAACYAAKVTLIALGEVFEAARDIMDWLGDCAKVIASDNKPVRWTTPLGLPIVQPYFRGQRYCVRTSLQSLAMQREGNSIEARKQRSAFPPNFVHSLDSSHMMMTAIACRDSGLHFAGVHDSFWTHACDVDKMNKIIREKFVELYSTPILENLLEGFQTSHPTLVFPPIPKRGDFDLREVLKSPYFFN